MYQKRFRDEEDEEDKQDGKTIRRDVKTDLADHGPSGPSSWADDGADDFSAKPPRAGGGGFDTPTVGRQRYDDLSATGTGTRTNRWDDATAGGSTTGGHLRQGWGPATPTPAQGHTAGWGEETPTATGTVWNPMMDPTPGGLTRMGLGTPTPVDSRFFHQGIAPPTMKSGMYPANGGSGGGDRSSGDGPKSPEEEIAFQRLYEEMWARNGPINDEEILELIPEGYTLVARPANYRPQLPMNPFRAMGPPPSATRVDVGALGTDLPPLRDGDYQTFSGLAKFKDQSDAQLLAATHDQVEEREALLLRYLLRVKNGSPNMRKSSMRHIVERARWFREDLILTTILNVLMTALEEQERHLMVKILNRVIFVLGKSVTPQIHRVLTIIEPMLMSEDFYEKAEAREVIANLARATGLGAMVAAMRNDVERDDESVRNWTASAFAVVGQALGIRELLRFLEPLCRNSKSWAARFTGIKVVQKISELMGNGVLPYLKDLIQNVVPGLEDPHPKMKAAAAISISALAEACAPFGIEHFQQAAVLLYEGTNRYHGKSLLAFLKAMGSLVLLMAPSDVNDCTQAIFVVMKRLLYSADEEMKKVVLRVLKQCITTPGVDPNFILHEIVPEYMHTYWGRRMALAARNYKTLIETTVLIAEKVGVSEILTRIVPDLRDDENEAFRRMVLEAIDAIVTKHGVETISTELECTLMDGLLYVFREQTEETDVVSKGIATVLNALGSRCKFYLPQLFGAIKGRLRNNKTPRLRQFAADLIVQIPKTCEQCNDPHALLDLSKTLYEMILQEEETSTLASILQALHTLMKTIGFSRFTGSDRTVSAFVTVVDIVNQLKHILANRNERVQEACIALIGSIAEEASEPIPKADWNRVCFQMLDLLKSHKKAVRKATIRAFGHLAIASDPVHVINTLLDNLKIQERQQRICTTVALAVIADMCEPYVVIPFLMNEYRSKDPNVKNGVLKSLAFLFEYVGPRARHYVYRLVSLLEDALMDKDRVHRQIACNVVRNICLCVYGCGYENVLIHLFNLVWPNIFDTDVHGIAAVMDVVEAMRLAVGPTFILYHVLAGLFHPSRKVREVYWRVYNQLYIAASDELVPSFPRLALQTPCEIAENPMSDGTPLSKVSFRRQIFDVFI